MCVALSCKFGGETIPLLELLEGQLISKRIFDRVFYIFPLAADNDGFMKTFKSRHTVYFAERRNVKRHFRLWFTPDRRVLRELEQLLIENETACIHCHYGSYDFIMNRLAKKLHVPLLVHAHNSPFTVLTDDTVVCRLKRFYNRLYHRLYLNAARVIAVGRGEYVCLLRNKIRRVTLVENAVCAERFLFKPAESRPVSSFAFIGTRFEKGVECLLKAAALARANESFSVTLVYSEATEDFIRRFIREHQLEPAVRLVYQGEVIGPLLEETDASISSSSFETFSYFVAESLAAGHPCILSDIAGTRWAAESGNAVLFKEGDWAGLADTMQRLLHTPPDPEAALTGRRFIENRYLSDRWIGEMVALYEGLPLPANNGD